MQEEPEAEAHRICGREAGASRHRREDLGGSEIIMLLVDGNDPIDLGEIKNNIAIIGTAVGCDFELRIPWNIYNNSMRAGQRIRWEQLEDQRPGRARQRP